MNGRIAIFAGAALIGLTPFLMAVSGGGFPSNPTFQNVTVNQNETVNGTSAAPNQPYFNVERITASQSAAGSAVTDVVFNSANANRGGIFNTATGVFTAPVAGVYSFAGQMSIQNNTAGSDTINGIYFSKNNSTSGAGLRYDWNTTLCAACTINAASNGFWTLGAAVIQLAANDTVRVKVDLGAGGALTLNLSSKFEGMLLN